MTTLSDQCTSTGNDVDISMLNTEEFFAYSSYRASSPLPPQLSFEEELEQRPDNDFYRLLRKVEAEKSAKLKRKAEDLGFASWEEKESHDREKKRKRLEDYVREHGHPPPQRVYTKEEEAALKLQAERSLALDIKSKLGPGLHCDCEEHLVPGFCRQKLISYKSQGDDPTQFHYLHSLQPINLNISMNEGDRSNRTPDWWLDHVWGMQTQPGVLRLPQWAKRDEVVQSMINKDEVDEIMYHGDRKQSKNVSLTPEFVEDENVESLGGSKRHNQRNKQGKEEESAVGLASKQTLPGDTPKLNKAHANTPAIQPAESTADRPENQSHPKAKASSPRSRRAPRRVDSALGLDETKGVLRAQASGIKKRPRAVKGATKAATQ